MPSKLFSTLILALLLAVCSATSLSAARLSERTPIRLGVWWDPAHDGSGFEFFRAGDQIALVWYTYREDGLPAWYSAAGRFDAAGRWEAPLYKHRWAGDSPLPVAEVGRLKLWRSTAENLSLEWRLNGREGTQQLVPLPLSGVVPEIDHSGAWSDPMRPGFGLSLTEQGEHLVAGLYFYDSAGEPTWRLAQNGGRGFELAVSATSGTCPGCAVRPTQTLNERGWLSLEFQGESTLRADYRGASTAQWPLSGQLEQFSLAASRRPADRQLAAFDDEPALRRYLDDALLRSRNSNVPVVSSPPPTVAFSPTNLQEAGVDEADRLKTDGRYLYTFGIDPQTRVANVLRVAEVDDGGSQLSLHPSVLLPGLDTAGRPNYQGLFLTERHVATLRGSRPSGSPFASLWIRPPVWQRGFTQVSIFERGLAAAPRLIETLEFDAHLVASRRIGERLHLVLRKSLAPPAEFEYGTTVDAARDQRNRERIALIPTQEMLPQVRAQGGVWRSLLEAGEVFLSVDGTVPSTPEFVAIVTIDLNAPDRQSAIAVAGPTAAVYVSQTRMYLATSRRGARVDPVLGFQDSEGFALTDIHQIALDAERPTFVASAAVEGYLDRDADRAPFRFSERDGKLRLVTVGGSWGSWGANRLTVLEPSTLTPGLLRTLSFLPNRDRPAPLGKPDEMLYGTRFVGQRLYAVTFLKTDPLYVVDLSDPAAPAIAGELELPGFSDYLHPVGDDLLLGLGLDARPAQSGWGDTQFAWFQGLSFTLFDVSDPNQPRLLQQRLLGKRGSYSAILRDHHALSVLPGDGSTRFAVPVRVHLPDGSEPAAPEDNYAYPWAWSGLQSLEVVGSTPGDARLELGPALATHRRETASSEGFYDDAISGARSVQFAQGVVYVEEGRFWRMDRDGGNVSGPH